MKKVLKGLLVIPTSLTLLLASCGPNNSVSSKEDLSSSQSSNKEESASNSQKEESSSAKESSSASESSSSVEQATIKAISIKELPTQVTYKLWEYFDIEGLKVQKEMSDGTFIELDESEYTIDYESVDPYNSGKYNVTITLDEDESFTTSFEVEYVVPTTINVKEGYDSKFLLNDYFQCDDYEFVLTYGDGSTEDIDSYSVYYDSPDMSVTGKKTVNFKYEFYDHDESNYINVEVEIEVFDPDTLTVDSFRLEDVPENITYPLANKEDVNEALYNVYGLVSYSEIGNKDFCVYSKYGEDDEGFEIDYSALNNATEAGTYNVVVTYHDKTINIPVTLIDVSSYTLSALTYNPESILIDTYYVGERISSYSLLDGLEMSFVYKKDGFDDITLPVYNTNVIDVVEGGQYFEQVGTKTLHFTLFDDETLNFSYEVNVKASPTLENGYYLDNENYERILVCVDGVVSLYDSWDKTYEGNLVLSSIDRGGQDNNEYLEVNYYDEDNYRSFQYKVSLEDDSIMNLYKVQEDDHYLTVNFTYSFSALNYEFFIKGGVVSDDSIPSVYQEMFQMLNKNYTLHKGSVDGEVVENVDGLQLESDITVYGVFNSLSGEGKEFIGLYDGTGSVGTGVTLEILSDKMTIIAPNGKGGTDTMDVLYNYKENEGKYEFATDTFYEISYENNTLTLSINMLGMQQTVIFERHQD